MYPHERSLVEAKRKSKFTLLGIDSDSSPAVLRAAMEREKITWPVIFGGAGGGHLAAKWGVHSWPTIFVVDAKGVIRAKDLREERLTAKVDELLAEIEKPPSKKK